jgi:hypothetical protein
LREAGVELPASVVSELELAGVAIERCFGDGRRAVGVRLDPADDPASRSPSNLAEPLMPTDTEAEPTAGTHEAPVRETRFGASHRRRILAVTALLAGVAALCSVIVMWAAGGDRGTRVPMARRSHPRVVAAAGASRPARPHRPAHPAPRVPVSPALASELEAQGHDLLEAGRYEDAVPVLKRAVLATGETVGACLEPASPTCLTYAYALYDLGRATRLNGEPRAAVPILERRLQIDNQRSTVVAELQLARAGIG